MFIQHVCVIYTIVHVIQFLHAYHYALIDIWHVTSGVLLLLLKVKRCTEDLLEPLRFCSSED